MFTSADLAVLCAYCALYLGLGWYFRRHTGSTSDYFRAGGRMPWWLVGGSSFISTFSAWTFTGAAGLAYDHGIVVITFYLINALGFVFAACCLAEWFRQTRVITAMEAVAQRFGRANEQIFTWLQIPVQMVISAVWLYGMAIFFGPIVGLDVRACILIGGGVVVFMSAAGGSWAVLAGDFVQTLLVMPVTGLLAFAALRRIGGLGGLVHHLPRTHLDPFALHSPGLGLWWIAAVAVEKFVLQNGLANSTRFLSVKSSGDARKAAFFAAVLTTAAALVWFIPPLVAKALQLDLTGRFPGSASPSECSYAAMALDLLPAGALGLLLAGILGTTLSAMDTGLNRNSGIFVRSIYRPLFRPNATDAELVRAGKWSTWVMGAAVLLIALAYNAQNGSGIFRLMMNISSMLGVPIGIPLFLGLFVRRTPDWAAWSTVLIGFAVSAALWVLPASAGSFARWLAENEYAGRMLVNASICSLWFAGTRLCGDRVRPSRAQEIETFFRTMHTPVDALPTKNSR